MEGKTLCLQSLHEACVPLIPLKFCILLSQYDAFPDFHSSLFSVVAYYGGDSLHSPPFFLNACKRSVVLKHSFEINLYGVKKKNKTIIHTYDVRRSNETNRLLLKPNKITAMVVIYHINVTPIHDCISHSLTLISHVGLYIQARRRAQYLQLVCSSVTCQCIGYDQCLCNGSDRFLFSSLLSALQLTTFHPQTALCFSYSLHI